MARNLDRRQVLRTGLALGAAPLLAACTGGGSGEGLGNASGGGSGSGGGTEIAWWDQYRPLTELFENELFAPYSKAHEGVTVARRQLEAPELGQALQLGRRSQQLPDVFSVAGLGSNPAALVANDWFTPIGDHVDIEGTPVAEHLYDGVHRFDGKVYSFPVFTSRWHEGNVWLNTQMLEQADVDPGNPPPTWDAFREVARTLTQRTPDGVYGLLLPMKAADNLSLKLESLAMIAGAPGPGGIDWRTGEYVWSSDPFHQAMEFMLALVGDGTVHPGSSSMSPRDARARWVVGQGAMYMWGPWFIGGLKVEEAQAVDRGIAPWPIPAPQTSRSPIYAEPARGTFWVSSQSRNPEVAADLMAQILDPAFLRKLAAAMDVPPILEDVVAEAEVHPAYRANLEIYQQDVRIAPQPQVRNADISTVLGEMRDVHPDPGEIVQGVLAGSIPDYRAALRTYNDQLSKERDRAIGVVKGKGAEVSVEDWVFADWDPRADYGQDKYQ